MNNIISMISQFKNNPMAAVMQRFNIPRNMTNPQEMVQHLLDSGQVTQDQVNNAMKMRPQIQNLMK